MVVFSSELLAYYDLTFIILVSTVHGRGIQAVLFLACIAVSVTTPRDKPVASLPTVCEKLPTWGASIALLPKPVKR
jgi:hypothetical protein